MTAERDFRRDLELAIGSEYEIREELGRGSSSVVFRGRDLVLGREVAIKVIRGTQLEDPEAVSRFEREARVLARLQHPNIVMLYVAKQLAGGSLALVMQHSTKWRTLKSVVRERGPLPPEAAERILIDLASALQYLHGHHIVHRDIKPENIFVETETGRALLADFGIAKPGDGQASVTLTGVVIGTPAYMSPEQIDGIEVTGRSDIYSLGMVGYEMLTGRRPWAGENLYSVIFRQKTEQLPSLAELRPDVPDELRVAIERATEKSPADRWEDAEELLSHFGSSPVPPSTPAEMPEIQAPVALEFWDEPEPEPANLDIEESPTVNVAGLLADADLEDSYGPPPSMRSRSRMRRSKGVGIAAAVVVLLGIGAAAVAMTNPGPDLATSLEEQSLPFPPEAEIFPTADVAMAAEPAESARRSSALPPTNDESPPATSTPTPQLRGPEPLEAEPPPETALVTGSASDWPELTDAFVEDSSLALAAVDSGVLGSVALPPPPAPSVAASRSVGSGRIRETAAPPRSVIPASAAPKLQNARSFVERLERIYSSTAKLPGSYPQRRSMVVAVLVNERGDVLDSQIRSSSGVGYLDDAALFASKLMRFSPAADPSVPIRVWVTVPLTLEP